MEEEDLVEVALGGSDKGGVSLHGYLHPQGGQYHEDDWYDNLYSAVGIDVFDVFGGEGKVGGLGWGLLLGVRIGIVEILGPIFWRLINSH